MLDFFASAELMREVDAFSCISRLKIETDRSSGSRPQGLSTWRQYSQAKLVIVVCREPVRLKQLPICGGFESCCSTALVTSGPTGTRGGLWRPLRAAFPLAPPRAIAPWLREPSGR